MPRDGTIGRTDNLPLRIPAAHKRQPSPLSVTRTRPREANMATPELKEFLTRLRSGDRQAVEELLRELDPFLRRAIRLRLIDGRLRRVLDTTDIYQSLLKDFLSQEHPPVETSAGLCAYLAAAVHHKIHTRTRKERRHAGSLPEDWDPVGLEASACQQVE